jgi:hypothetical protein
MEKGIVEGGKEDQEEDSTWRIRERGTGMMRWGAGEWRVMKENLEEQKSEPPRMLHARYCRRTGATT